MVQKLDTYKLVIKSQETGSIIRTFCENTIDLIENGKIKNNLNYSVIDASPNGNVKLTKLKPNVIKSGSLSLTGQETPLVWFRSVLKNIPFFEKHGFHIDYENSTANIELVDSIKYKKSGKKYVNNKELEINIFSGDRLVIAGSKARIVLSCDVTSKKRAIHLDSIVVYNTGNGLGRQIMRILSCISKGLDVEMTLGAAPIASENNLSANGLTHMKLRKFYEKFGFEITTVLGTVDTKMYMMSNKKVLDAYYA